MNIKHVLFMIASVSFAAAAEPDAHVLQLGEHVMHKLKIKKEKFDDHSIGFSFTYQLMLLERLDRKLDKDLFTMLSESFIKRYFEYFIQVELGLRNADRSIGIAFSSAVAKKLINTNAIIDNKLNFGSGSELMVKTPYGALLDDKADEKLSAMFREHVIKMTSLPQENEPRANQPH